MPLGQLMAEFPSGGWVHGVSFSPDGNRVAWVSHDSSIAVATAGGTQVASLNTSGLPLLKCLWLSPLKVVAAVSRSNNTGWGPAIDMHCAPETTCCPQVDIK